MIRACSVGTPDPHEVARIHRLLGFLGRYRRSIGSTGGHADQERGQGRCRGVDGQGSHRGDSGQLPDGVSISKEGTAAEASGYVTDRPGTGKATSTVSRRIPPSGALARIVKTLLAGPGLRGCPALASATVS
jgi:hypothetical protein